MTEGVSDAFFSSVPSVAAFDFIRVHQCSSVVAFSHPVPEKTVVFSWAVGYDATTRSQAADRRSDRVTAPSIKGESQV